MKFKIGDRVRVVKSNEFSDLVGGIYTVSEVENDLSSFVCRIKQGVHNTLMYDWEIEIVAQKGLQLEFSFMDEVV